MGDEFEDKAENPKDHPDFDVPDINVDEGTDAVPTGESRITDLEDRAEKLLANWQRTQADLANFRRQVEREREDYAKLANRTLIASLLSIFDDLERALANVPDNLRSLTWVDGMLLIYRKTQAIVGSYGLEEMVVQVGDDFDPHRHQAVVEAEGNLGKIIDVIQKGYTINGQVLRPASVAVGRGEQSSEDDQQPDVNEQPKIDSELDTQDS